MGQLFGTDGVRGVANQEPLTPERVLELGRATAYVCKQTARHTNKHKIVIGKDTRISGYMLENALTAGICSMGVDVLLVGPMPTPGIAFITQSMRADAGLVLSASHNPYQDNGIKIFSRDGYKLPDEVEAEIEDLVLTRRIEDIRATAGEIGKAKRIDDAIGRYIVFCKNTFPQDLTLEGMKIVMDCANGATYKVAPIIFSELGADVTAIHDRPNGMNINDNCGSQFTADLAAAVVDNGADIGLAFDGDGDRLIALDEKGREMTGDHVLAVCAKMYKDKSWLVNNRVITTVMANIGLYKALEALEIDHGVSAVGDRYVLELMKKENAVLGGESSGHMIFLNHHTTGDGIISALQLLAAVQTYDVPVSQLADQLTVYPQKMINVEVSVKPPLDEMADVCAEIERAEQDLADSGRVLVRYSGTQSLCRVMVEGPTEELTTKWAEHLAKAVKKAIG